MPKLKNLIGQQFGYLTVIERGTTKNHKTYWKCRCACGQELEVRTDSLTSGNTKSCGCLHKESTRQQGFKNFKDITNQRFGKLVALQPIKTTTGKYAWICQCDCGNIVTVLGTSLRSGMTQSCGCLKSSGENKIEAYLQAHNISYKHDYIIQINHKNYKYDFALLNSQQQPYCFIEFDGIQHYGRISGWFTQERFNELQLSDNIKNQYAIDINLPLIRIPYYKIDEIDNILNNILMEYK